MNACSTLWLAGRPCAGKTTLARLVLEELKKRGVRATGLDGDDVRGGISSDLGFSAKDRSENLRRAAHMAKLLNENGEFVVAAFVSPTEAMRQAIREVIPRFKLCYVRCSPEVCEARDVKGMYRKARAGQIKDFTGVSAPFEEPRAADLTVDTEHRSPRECLDEIIRFLFIGGGFGD